MTDDRPPASRNARTGLWLCAVYILFYGSFVLLAAYRPEVMERTPWRGINLAVWYGFALIAGAIVLSLVYGALCSTSARETTAGDDPKESRS